MKRGLVAWLMVFTAVLLLSGEAAAGPVVVDDFNGPGLSADWQVLPGQGAYSVGAGNLRYYGEGPLSSPSGWSTTSLSLALPFAGTEWHLDAKATYNLGWCAGGSYSGPSTPNLSCSSGAQRSQLGVSFAPVTASDRSALAGGNYAVFDRGIDAYYGDNHLTASYGAATATGLLNPADATISNNIAGGTYWYRIVRNGGTLTMSYSDDGLSYRTALTTLLADPLNTYNELLLSGTTFSTVGSFTDYDFVHIVSPVPEPGSLMLLGIGLLGLGAARRRSLRRREVAA